MVNNRDDMTNWLIHFIHKKDINSIPDELPDEVYNTSANFEYSISDYDEFFTLKNIIYEAGIRFGYSFRNKKTTIYGGEPVICFTEMPFSSYLEYINIRDNELTVGNYAIAIEKSKLFEIGARPVIYGLSEDNSYKIKKQNSYTMILEESILPIKEQFRYVPYILNDNKEIDWTHEREWRLKYKNKDEYETCIARQTHYTEIKHFPIFNKEIYDKKIIIILQTNEEAKEFHKIITFMIDTKMNDFSVPFDNRFIWFLIVDNYNKLELKPSKIEDLPKECYYPIYKEEKISQNIFDEITRHIKILQSTIEEKNYKERKDLCGRAYVVCYDPYHNILVAMKHMDIAECWLKYYNIDIGIKFLNSFQSISINEKIAKDIAKYLNENLADIFSVKSYLD